MVLDLTLVTVAVNLEAPPAPLQIRPVRHQIVFLVAGPTPHRAVGGYASFRNAATIAATSPGLGVQRCGWLFDVSVILFIVILLG
jgi:hypothetical protein